MSLLWDLLYLFKKTPWDTGVTPPEIVAMIDSGRVPKGQALDLGCGTGTNAIYLTQQGFNVTAIDVSWRAIGLARRKARTAELKVQFERGDASQVTRWAAPNSIDFACDIGCFHSLSSDARDRYVTGLRQVLRPGAIYMLYAFAADEGSARGISPDEIAARFADGFVIEQVKQGNDRNGRASAWYTVQRAAA
jgi:cyclopropane fatty-acyl-phospholipid synthase-like methyltransferase